MAAKVLKYYGFNLRAKVIYMFLANTCSIKQHIKKLIKLMACIHGYVLRNMYKLVT